MDNLSLPNERLLKLNNMPVPWFEYKNEKSLTNIHFSPANGIPAQSYDSFFKQLQNQFNISAMDTRGAWEHSKSPDESLTFENYADDLIAALESQYNEPIIGIGHSLGGAVTILAAIKRPELFSKVVLIDPASTPTVYANFLFQLLPQFLQVKFFPFIKGSLRRRRVWDSREQFFNHYREHRTFERFTDQALLDYAQYGLRKLNNNQYELIFAPEWEAFNFRRVGFLWDSLVKLQTPTLFIRAEYKSLYSQATFIRYNRQLKTNVIAKTLPTTSHLMTHEQTDVVSAAILEWLNK